MNFEVIVTKRADEDIFEPRSFGEKIQIFGCTVNGIEATFLPRVRGSRPKFRIDLNGVAYFIKLGTYQTIEEITLLTKTVEPNDRKFFIAPVSYGVSNDTTKQLDASYIMQPFITFDDKDVETRIAYWDTVERIAIKYDLIWDLCLEKNWSFIGDQPVIFDAAPYSDD